MENNKQDKSFWDYFNIFKNIDWENKIVIPVKTYGEKVADWWEHRAVNFLSEWWKYLKEDAKDFFKAIWFLSSEISATKYSIEQQAFEEIKPLRCDTNTALDFIYKNLFDEEQAVEFLGRLGINPEYAKVYYTAYQKQLTATDYVQSLIRGVISYDDYLRELKRLGIDERNANIFLANSLRLPNESDLFINWLRGYINEDELNDWLKRLGIDEDAINLKKNAVWYYPSASDWVYFARRDIFNPEVVEKFGYDEAYPEHIEPEVIKAGLKPEHFKYYWRAHWRDLGTGEIFEMLHRRVIDYDEALLLLKSSNFAPKLAEKLIQISYSPYTRVDIRRMYALGVVDELEVFKTYLDLGYDKEKAKNLTKFTILYTQPDKKTLSFSKIEKGYKRRWFDKKEALKLLKDLGYSEYLAELIINYWDLEIEEELIESKLNVLKKQYLNGIIDLQGLAQQLVKLNLPANEIDYLLQVFENEKEAKRLSLSIQDIMDAVYYGIISEEEGIRKLKNKGYTEEDAKIKIKLNALKKSRGVMKR